MGWSGSGVVDEGELGEADVARLLDEGVARTVEYVWSRSAFWRRRLEAAGVGAGEVQGVADLSRLPLMSKADLAAGGRDLWCQPPERVVDIVTTSGTTGAPTIYPMTDQDVRRLGYNEYLSFTCAGLTPADTVLLAVTMDRCFMAGLAYYEGLRQVGASAVRVGSGTPGMLLGLIGRLRPTAIVSVPSFLNVIARYAAEREMDLAASTVTKLICIGEPVRTADLGPTPLARHLSEVWGASVCATYGVTELAGSLCECPAGCGGHLHPELLHIEIVDDAGLPVPDGAVGEIVATTIGVEALPVIRFRTGDQSYLIRDRCACGRRTPRTGAILGRRDHMLKLKGTTVYPAAVKQALEALPEVEDFVMIATSPDPLSDHLEVVVAVSGDAVRAKSLVERHLQGALKVTPAVRTASVDEVAALQGAGQHRKKRIFIDRRSTDPPSHQVS